MKGAEKILPENFKEGIRMIMLTQRSKEGGKSHNSDRVSKRKLSFNKEEFEKIYNEYKNIKSTAKVPLRIYSSINSRNIEKGILQFKRLQLETDYWDIESKHRFYMDIKNRFMSCIMKPKCKETSYFVIDIDENENEPQLEEVMKELKDQNVKIIMQYKTPNGTHIITYPYNPNNTPSANIKKDGLLLLNY